MAGKTRDATPEPAIDDETGPQLELGAVDELEDEASRQSFGRRASGHPADREHGMKTRVRSKQIVSEALIDSFLAAHPSLRIHHLRIRPVHTVQYHSLVGRQTEAEDIEIFGLPDWIR